MGETSEYPKYNPKHPGSRGSTCSWLGVLQARNHLFPDLGKMKVTVLFFARSREITGTPDTVVELEAGMEVSYCAVWKGLMAACEGCVFVEAIVGVGNTELCRLPCCMKRCVAMVIGATSQDLLKLLLQQYPQLQKITGMTPCYQCGRF